ncbi:nucleotidyltransferase domain-containing protein [Priestia megaterium]
MQHKFQLDLTLMPQELKVLLELIKDDNNEHIQKYKNEWFTKINWDYFLKLAMHHRIYPLVYLKLKEVAPELTPSYVLKALQVEYTKNTFQMLHLSGEMERISKLFTENQIRSLFLKGPVIAHYLYGDISLRTSKDLDIFIPETDLEKAENLLLNEGYEKEEVLTVLNEIKWRYHHIAYFHPIKKIQIEIHWRLHPRPMKEPKFQELWERKRTSSLTRHTVSFLGKEDLMLYLITHGSRHGWFRLRWLLDINEIMKKVNNFNRIRLLLKSYNVGHLAGQTFLLASQLLNTSIDREFNKLIEDKKNRRLAKKAISYIEVMTKLHMSESNKLNIYYTYYQFVIKTNKEKFLFIIILLYPNSSDIETLKLPRFLVFLYFPLRPFLWIWRKSKYILNKR